MILTISPQACNLIQCWDFEQTWIRIRAQTNNRSRIVKSGMFGKNTSAALWSHCLSSCIMHHAKRYGLFPFVGHTRAARICQRRECVYAWCRPATDASICNYNTRRLSIHPSTHPPARLSLLSDDSQQLVWEGTAGKGIKRHPDLISAASLDVRAPTFRVFACKNAPLCLRARCAAQFV